MRLERITLKILPKLIANLIFTPQNSKLISLTLGILLVSLVSANANTITLLNTFPTEEIPLTSSIPIYSSFEWQQAAVPFHVEEAGRLTQINTAITSFGGDTPLVVKIVDSNFEQIFFEQTICSTNSNIFGENYCVEHEGSSGLVSLAPGEFYNWNGELYLDPGDYWLIGGIEGDDAFGTWYTNENILTDTWVAHSLALTSELADSFSFADASWATVGEFGPVLSAGHDINPGGAYATPIARVTFSPVPEPSTILLLGGGLLGLGWYGRKRKNA